MEFTAGLMPLETALSQMLSRITPLTAPSKRCRWFNALPHSGHRRRLPD